MAALGVIFFSQLSHNAASSAQAATPKLRAELQAALSPSTRAPIIAGFAVCFHDRATSTDPSAMPTSCRSLALTSTRAPSRQQSVAARRAFADAATTARRRNFVTSIQRTLWWEIAALLTCGLLMLLLPGKRTTPSAGGQCSAAATRAPIRSSA